MQKNRNLDRGLWIGDASSTRRRKVAWFGTSQSEQNSVRMGGHIPRQIQSPVTGLMVYTVSNQAVGIYNLNATVAGMTRRNPQPATSSSDPNAAWGGDGNESDNLGYSLELAFSSNITINTEIHRTGLVQPGLFFDLDLDSQWIMRSVYRSETTTLSGIKLAAFSGATVGTASSITFPPVDTPGTINIQEFTLPGTDTLGSPGDTPRGVVFQTNTGNDTGKYLPILGNAFIRSDDGSTPVDFGLMFASVFQGGYSAYDHINRISSAARQALIEAFDGFDEVWIEIGHNPEDSGRVEDNVKALGHLIMQDHAAKGYPLPKIGIVIPWASSGSSFDAASADRLERMAWENRWGCVNFWEIYNGTDPGTNGMDYHGNPRAYNMDGSNLHPADSTTAGYIAEDFLSAFGSTDRIPSYSDPYVDVAVV